MSAVLLLHGFLGRGSDWAPVRALLGAEAEALTPDLPGHGRAVGLPGGAYTMNGASDRLVALLDARGVERAIVAGYSMGGRLALHLALQHPSRVSGLVLVSASPGLRSEAERAERRRLDAARAAGLDADLPGFLDRWYRMPLFASLDAATRERLAARRAGNDPAELGRSLAGMGAGVQPSHWEHLHRLCVPAWAVVGARDAKFVRIAEAMAAAGPVTVRIVPDAGHALLDEAPDAIALLLRDLLPPHPITPSPPHPL